MLKEVYRLLKDKREYERDPSTRAGVLREQIKVLQLDLETARKNEKYYLRNGSASTWIWWRDKVSSLKSQIENVRCKLKEVLDEDKGSWRNGSRASLRS